MPLYGLPPIISRVTRCDAIEIVGIFMVLKIRSVFYLLRGSASITESYVQRRLSLFMDSTERHVVPFHQFIERTARLICRQIPSELGILAVEPEHRMP